jgi:rhamnogalacturonyl hydrolase YesR
MNFMPQNTLRHTLLLLLLIITLKAAAQTPVKNDVTTPLHALQPDYPVPYGAMSKDSIIKTIDRIFNYLDRTTPAQLINKTTGAAVTNVSQLDTNTIIKQGDFRLYSYEWGVTYSALLLAAETTGDKKYSTYVKKRFDFMSQWLPQVKQKIPANIIRRNNLFSQPINPRALDDAGAVCASMIKAMNSGLIGAELRPQVDVYIDFIANKEYRLSDGTLARNRPQKNTLWLDDLYMGVPSIAQMGKLTGDNKYFDDAVRQIRQFTERMFNKEKGVFMHGWVESMEPHPGFYWARANGWALMAMTELLDVLPESHSGRSFVLDQFRQHVKGLASYQSGSGFWHQLLDRTDSYLETSATAIYAYCIAHACNKGWIDPKAYAAMAMLAWNAVATKINAQGQVEGTCVGTGMAFDPAFYYHRPVNVFAAHGYGPALLAGAEIYRMVNKNAFKINDSALMYYVD